MQTDQFKGMKVAASIVAIVGLFLPWFSTNLCLLTIRTNEWFRYGLGSLIFGTSRFFESKRIELWYQVELMFRRFPEFFVVFALMYLLFLAAITLLIVNLIQIVKNEPQKQTNVRLVTISLILLVICGIGSLLGGLGLHAVIRNLGLLNELSYRLSFGYYVTLASGIGMFVLTRLTSKQPPIQLED